MKKKFTALQEACRRAGVGLPSSIINVAGLALGRISLPVSGEVLSNDALRRTSLVSEL